MNTRSNQSFVQPLHLKDEDVFHAMEQELKRQEEGIELIASENYASSAVIEAQGSVLTNKYAEGYPGKRYYGGCEEVDKVELLAIQRLCKIFGAEAANVQAHSGSQANMAAYFSLVKPGQKILGMSLSHGGHLTHGSPVNFSGKLFEVVSYGLSSDTECLDYDQIRDLARREKPAMIVAGASAYPRIIDFKIFGEIAQEINAPLVVDMAHIAGLVAAGEHPSPIPYATLTTSTTHKTLRGPRGGVVLGSADRMKAVNSQIFPGIQGGPLMHVIAAKAVAFGEALSPEFKDYQRQVVKNARALASMLSEQGVRLVTGGTDNHLMLLDLTSWANDTVSGKDAETWLDKAGITVNKNTIPGEKRSPFVTSGIRVGTPAMTTRGLKESEMRLIGRWIVEVLSSKGEDSKLARIRAEVREMLKQFPLYGR